jgi:type I restriction enzyme S subunit
MVDAWPNVALEEVADLSGGYAFKSEEYAPFGQFVLRTLNIGGDGRVNRDQAVYIPLGACAPYERFQLRPNDILFVMVGATLGKIGIVTERDLPALLNQNMWRIRAIDKAIDERFLFYSFKYSAGSGLAGASGSARLFVRRDDYRRLAIPFPPIKHQQAIAQILGALDDKIDLNRRMNETLGTMQRAIFMDQQERCDWPELRLSDVSEIFDGPHATPKLVDTGPIFLGISNLSNGRLDLTTTKHVSPQDFAKWTRRVAPTSGDVVFSYETRLGEASLIPKSFECCLGRRMGLLRLTTNEISPTLLLQAYMAPSFQETIRRRTIHGSTVDRLPLIDLGDFPIRLPTGIDAATLTRMLEPLDAKIDANDRERNILSNLRDLLFPKLISGETRMKDAEKIVQAAL